MEARWERVLEGRGLRAEVVTMGEKKGVIMLGTLAQG